MQHQPAAGHASQMSCEGRPVVDRAPFVVLGRRRGRPEAPGRAPRAAVTPVPGSRTLATRGRSAGFAPRRCPGLCRGPTPRTGHRTERTEARSWLRPSSRRSAGTDRFRSGAPVGMDRLPRRAHSANWSSARYSPVRRTIGFTSTAGTHALVPDTPAGDRAPERSAARRRGRAPRGQPARHGQLRVRPWWCSSRDGGDEIGQVSQRACSQAGLRSVSSPRRPSGVLAVAGAAPIGAGLAVGVGAGVALW